MLGKINRIEEVCGKKAGGWGSFEGYELETDKHIFSVLISGYQNCCESWGYFSTNDDTEDFIGQELLEVKLTDVALNEVRINEDFKYGFDCGGIQFVDFVTNKGVFQLAVYNSHNGYYGHSIYVLKDDTELLSDCL